MFIFVINKSALVEGTLHSFTENLKATLVKSSLQKKTKTFSPTGKKIDDFLTDVQTAFYICACSNIRKELH